MENIREKVIESIIRVTKKHSFEWKNNADENLMGLNINISPLELIYIFDILENEFMVKFTPEDIDNKNFYNINAITKRICDYKGIK